MSTANRARPLAPAASRPRAVRPTPVDRRIVEGRITAVLPDGRAKLITRAGATLPCHCPQHVSVDWLRAAVAVGPVEAEASTDGRTGTISVSPPRPRAPRRRAGHPSPGRARVAEDCLRRVDAHPRQGRDRPPARTGRHHARLARDAPPGRHGPDQLSLPRAKRKNRGLPAGSPRFSCSGGVI